MSTKEALIEMIRKMPDDATAEQMAYELYIRTTLDERIKQADSGDVIDNEEFKRRNAKWLG